VTGYARLRLCLLSKRARTTEAENAYDSTAARPWAVECNTFGV
jgi:hypothetical protein